MPRLLKRWLAACLVVVVGTLLPAATTLAVPPDNERPNIVAVMVDDLAFLDHRIWDRLPNIKSLFINHGIESLNYWGNDPLCCPGRANFLTGQVAHVNGVLRNDARLLDASETIATELDALGYYTNICGKYLNNAQLLEDKSPPGWDNAAIAVGGYYHVTTWVNDLEEAHGGDDTDYSTDVYARHCRDFLQAAPVDAPIFALLLPYATHGTSSDTNETQWEPIPATRHIGDPRCAGIPPWKPANYNSADLSGKPGYVRRRKLLGAEFADGFPLERRCQSLLAVDEWLGETTACSPLRAASTTRSSCSRPTTEWATGRFGTH